MGLPELSFSFVAAADTVADRMTSGIVALILTDEQYQGRVLEIHREADIPVELSSANKTYIKRALVGYLNRPEKVIAAVQPSSIGLDMGFKMLMPFAYDYIAGPHDISSEEAGKLGKLVQGQRSKRYVGKAVLPDTGADDEGVINFSASKINGSDGANAWCSRIAGLLAGTPAECSATSAPLPEVDSVTAVSDPDAAVDAGKLILVDDGRQVKLGRAVTSKVNLAPGQPQALKKIKLLSAIDLIRHYAVATVEDDYLGKCANTYENKLLLLTGFSRFFATLEARDVVVAGSSFWELDAKAIRAYLVEQATEHSDTEELERIKGLSDEALRKEDTGSHVFLHFGCRILDAMEDFHIVGVAQ